MTNSDRTEKDLIDDAISYVAISDSVVQRVIDEIPDIMAWFTNNWQDYCDTCHEVLEDHLTCEYQQNCQDQVVIEKAHIALDVALDVQLKKHIERLVWALETEIRWFREVVKCNQQTKG